MGGGHIDYKGFNEIMNNLKLDILGHGYISAGKKWEFICESAPYNRLFYIVSEKGTISSESKHIELKSGHAYFIPLNITKNYFFDEQFEKFYINFRFEIIPHYDFFEIFNDIVELPLGIDTVLDIVKMASSGKATDYVMLKGIFHTHIAQILSIGDESIQKQFELASGYTAFYKYIHHNCYADLRVGDIAEYLHMSESYLSRKFKRDFGINLKQYIDNIIVSKAKECLLASDPPIREIAAELKFKDEFYFSAFFKKHVGMSPSRYRAHAHNQIHNKDTNKIH